MPSQDDWGNKTLMNKVKELEHAMEEREEFDEKAQPHIETVAEIKTFMKWAKILALVITTIGGTVVALKHMGILD